MLIAVLLSLLCCGAVAAATIIRPAFLARLVYPATIAVALRHRFPVTNFENNPTRHQPSHLPLTRHPS